MFNIYLSALFHGRETDDSDDNLVRGDCNLSFQNFTYLWDFCSEILTEKLLTYHFI